MNIFILSHILGDFIFQKDSDVEAKNSGTIKGNLKHIAKVSILFIIAAVSLIIIEGITDVKQVLLILAFVAINLVFHFFLDVIKSRLQKKWVNKTLSLLIADQLLHIVVLVVTFNLLLGNYISLEYQGDDYVDLFIYLSIATFVSSVIIREVLNMFHLDTERETENQKEVVEESQTFTDYNSIKLGKWIGIFERTIMFLALYFNILGLLTIIVGFKTLTRYESIKNNPEYYIIGNLLSILLVLITYGLFKQFG